MIENFRKTAPAPLAPRPFNLPIPVETTLANGLKVVVVEDRRLPIVSFRLAFKTGAAHDAPNLTGLTGMMTAMLNEGTETRSSLEIAEQVERLGASLGASAGADSTVIAASALTQFADDVLELLADIVLNPVFPEDELNLQRDNAKQGLIAQRAQPAFLADEQLSKILFGTHPYSMVSATISSLDEITREKLVKFHKERFVPNNAVFVAVGDVSATELTAKLDALFGDWKPAETVEIPFAAFPQRIERTIYLVDRKGSAQSSIVLANLGITRSHKDFFPLLVMNQVLGAGASSRLFMNLREAKDFTYGAYSSVDARKFGGAIEATAEVRSAVTGEALKEFFYELDRIRDETIPEQELQDAKNYMTGVFPIRLETQEGLIAQLVTMQMYDLPADYLQTYRDKIEAISAHDAQTAARKHITPDKMAIVIVGDAETIQEQIAPFAATIELFDTEGKKKELNTKELNEMNNTETWNLNLSSPQGELPVTMVLENTDGNLSGNLTTPVGAGTISGGTLAGNQLNATASLDFQGMPVSVEVVGVVDGDSISGSVNTAIIGSLKFHGTRAN